MTAAEQKLFIEYLLEAEDIVSLANKQINDESKRAAKDIIALCLLYGINIKDFKYDKLPEKAKEQLRAILSDLRQSVFSAILLSSESTKDVSRGLNEAVGHGDNDLELNTKDYIERDIAGKTIHNRINEQVNRLSREFEAYIAIGIAGKLSEGKILDSIWNNRKTPFVSRTVSDAMKTGGFSAVRLSREYHPRAGFSTSALKQLERIGEMTIMQTYHHYNEMYWDTLGKNVKYKTQILSGNPCQICIDSQYVLHDYNPLPWHVNCKCVCFPLIK